MASNRAHFADALTPGFRKIFDDAFAEEPMLLEKLFHVNTSVKDTEKDSGVTGFALPQETSEGAPINYDDPVQMYDVTYSHRKYSQGFKVTRETIEDDLYRIISKLPDKLGRAMRRGAENQAANVFIRAFTAAYSDGGDSEELASTVHPRSDAGASQSNASATGITFTEDNLETGRQALIGQLDDRGLIIDVMPDMLIIPIELEKDAHIIVDTPMRSGTADNDMNFNQSKFEIVMWKYLTSATAWFLMDKSQHQLNWFWRRRPEFANDELFDTEYAVYKSTMRFSNGWSDWRGFWGSQGDGASYSS